MVQAINNLDYTKRNDYMHDADENSVGKVFTPCIKLDNCDIFYNMVTSLITVMFIAHIRN